MVTLDRLIPQEHYTVAQISPYFWPNGKMPEREDWKRLAAEGFKNYKLRIGGLVENPVELSLADSRVWAIKRPLQCIIAFRAGAASRNGGVFPCGE